MTRIGYASAPRPPSRDNLDIHRNKCRRCQKSGNFPPPADHLCRVGAEHLRDYLVLQEVYQKWKAAQG